MSLAGVQVRDAEGDAPPVIFGYGAVFYDGTEATEFRLWGDVRERVLPGAFDNVLENDVRSLFNHDANLVLGRNRSGTLSIAVDDVGLRFEVTPPESRSDVLDLVRRGDVDGASFMFSVSREDGGEVVWRENEDGEVREIVSVARLFELGPVTFPAYEATSANARDITAAQAEHEARLELRQAEQRTQRRTQADADALALDYDRMRTDSRVSVRR
jgi:hypothetical protein